MKIMENLSAMYHLFWFIMDPIFLYLRDIILYEFTWFAEEMDELNPSTVKTRTNPFTRKAVANFVCLFTICAFFGSFVVLSSKCTKEESYRKKDRPEPMDSEGEVLELLEDDDCTILSPPEKLTRGYPWGDGKCRDFEPLTRSKINSQGRNQSPEIRESTSSIFELRQSNSQHSQSTQTCERIIKRAAKNRDWLIRRTRSGHVYGKYPM